MTWKRLTLVLAVAAMVSSCGGAAIRSFGGDDDADMFVAGLEHIEAVYIDPVDLGDVTMGGLAGLLKIDPRLAVDERPGHRALLLDGRIVKELPEPRLRDADSWGVLTADAVVAARTVSPAVRDTSTEAIYEAVFDGMMERLDGYSRYASAADAAENRASREGFGGIGVRISVEEGVVRVVSVMHYTPAERGGLKEGDIIAEVDGRPIGGLDQEQVIDLLRGPVDSKVVLTILRDEVPRPIELVRAHVVPETVAYRREGDVGYLRVYSFNLETAESLRKEMSNAEREIGAGLKGYVLDLRGNPGGLLDQAVAVADLFLEEGGIVSTRGRHPDSHQRFEATSGDFSSGRPVVALINGNSASASEIVAAALQDDERAVVIGSNSFGKGTVQNVIRMPNDGELTLTWARFHAPSGYTLNHLGVLPTVCTGRARDDAAVNALVDALRRGRIEPIPTGARNATDPNDTAALDRLRASCPGREDEDGADLNFALRLLGEPSLYSRALALADNPDLASAAP